MKKVFSIFGLAFLVSCGSSIKGEIEYRNDNKDCYGYDLDGNVDYAMNPDEYRDKNSESKSAYLINKSLDKPYEFTIKEVETIDDTIINYRTTKIKLSPGDEKWLGCVTSQKGAKYYKKGINDTLYRTDADTLTADEVLREFRFYKYKNIDDTTRPKKRSIVLRKYSCTGQRLITNPKELGEIK